MNMLHHFELHTGQFRFISRQGSGAKKLSKNNLHPFQPFFEPRRTRRARRNHFVLFVFFVVKESLFIFGLPQL
jgi:hypothetical protein